MSKRTDQPTSRATAKTDSPVTPEMEAVLLARLKMYQRDAAVARPADAVKRDLLKRRPKP